jgi:hypothetical protein
MLEKGKWRETLHKVLAFFSREKRTRLKKNSILAIARLKIC